MALVHFLPSMASCPTWQGDPAVTPVRRCARSSPHLSLDEPMDTSLLVGNSSNNLRDGPPQPRPLSSFDVASICTLLWQVPTSMRLKDKLVFSCVNRSNYENTVAERQALVSRLYAANCLARSFEYIAEIMRGLHFDESGPFDIPMLKAFLFNYLRLTDRDYALFVKKVDELLQFGCPTRAHQARFMELWQRECASYANLLDSDWGRHGPYLESVRTRMRRSVRLRRYHLALALRDSPVVPPMI